MPDTVIAERDRLGPRLDNLEGRGRAATVGVPAAVPGLTTTYLPGEVAQFDFWFPEVTIPVGARQHPTATQERRPPCPPISLTTHDAQSDSGKTQEPSPTATGATDETITRRTPKSYKPHKWHFRIESVVRGPARSGGR